MTPEIDIKGNDTKEMIMNAKLEGLNYYVTPANSSYDHNYFFETQEEADEYASKFDEELVTVWDLNDDASNEVLLQD